MKQLRGGPLELLPSQLELPEGRIEWRGESWLPRARIDLRLAIARHLRAEAPGPEKLRLADAELRIAGELAGIAFTPVAEGAPRFELASASGGVLDGHRKLVRGSLAQGSTLQVALPASAVDEDGRTHQESLRASLQSDGSRVALNASLVPKTPGVPKLDATLRLDGVRIAPGGVHDSGPEVWLERVSGRIAGELGLPFAALAARLPPRGEGPLCALGRAQTGSRARRRRDRPALGRRARVVRKAACTAA